MECYLFIFIMLVIIFVVVWIKNGIKIAAISLAVSIGLAFLAFKAVMAYSMADISRTGDWHQVTDLDHIGRVNRLDYKPESGLLALTADAEIKVADSIPTCLPEGEVAVNLSSDTYAELTQTPRLGLAPFAGTVVQQLSFDIVYPVGADELGLSSYLLDENGQVWCSEIYARGGLGMGAAVALGSLFLAALIAIGVFFISLVGMVLVMRRRSADSA